MNKPHALLIAAVLCACSPSSPISDGSKAPLDERKEAAMPLPSADDLLQARLRQAVADYERSHAMRAPEGTKPAVAGGAVSGRRPPEVIQRIVRQSFGRFRLCYENGLRKNASLKGSVVIEMMIDTAGKVTETNESGDLPDKTVKACVKKAFASLEFPPAEGPTRVTYPIKFAPDDGAPPGAPSSSPSDPLASPKSSAAPAPAAPPAAESPSRKSLPPPDGPWPIVVVEGSKVLVDRKEVADVSVILKGDRIQKIDGAFDAMKAWRDDWKSKHPDLAFPGVVGLRVEPGTPALVLKSVFQTLAYAGFPEVYVQSADEPASIHELATQVPAPPNPALELEPRKPPRWLSLHLGAEEATIVWKEGAVVVTEEKAKPAALATKVCDSWKKQGEHRAAEDPHADQAVVHVDQSLRYGELKEALDAVRRCTRPGADGAARPAFWITFSVR